MPKVITVMGGWGYNNLGDEAILAGYLETFAGETEVRVTSVDPDRTSHAQLKNPQYFSEGQLLGSSAITILGGGGYLNGSWVPEIYSKLRRLNRDRGGSALVAHAEEVRGFSGRFKQRALATLLQDAKVSVRDNESLIELEAVPDLSPSVQPDAISLLYPHLDRYRLPLPDLRGKVLVNLLDIAARPDSGEFDLGLSGYQRFVDELLDAIGNRAVGLVIGGGDYEFMRQYPSLPLLAPRTVVDLVSSISAADATFSVRMHPALIASASNKPVLAVPYCGKVRPTLSNLGISDIVLGNYDVDQAIELLSREADRSSAWWAAHASSRDWLLEATHGPASL
jgi:polysaccharide pyruvyl transferase WcaK-like protein